MLPHVLLLAVDLLLAGMQKRWALYLSMVLFGLAPVCLWPRGSFGAVHPAACGGFSRGAQKGEAA